MAEQSNGAANTGVVPSILARLLLGKGTGEVEELEAEGLRTRQAKTVSLQHRR